MSRRVTMRDVADHLGLHPSTVSLAFRDHPRIPAETRERVRLAAAQLGYEPDPLLGALANYRRAGQERPVVAELAWVNRWAQPERLHAFREFDLYWRGARAAALELGYRLERFDIGDAPLSFLSRVLRARNIVGMVVPPHQGANNEWDALDSSRLAVVRIGYSVRISAHAVGCDQTDAALLGCRRIHELGYGRVGFVTHPGAEAGSRFRAGYLLAQQGTAEVGAPPTLLLDGADKDADRCALDGWLREHQPDALLTTYGGTRALIESLGMQIGVDIGLAATSVLDGNCDAGIDQCAEEIGRAAVEKLDSLVTRGRLGLPSIPRMTMIRPRWVDGESLPPRAAQLNERS